MRTAHPYDPIQGPPQAPPSAPTTPGRPRGWWRVLGTLFAVVFLAGVVFQVVSLIGRSTETVRRVLPAEGLEQLEVDTGSGDVSIVGTDGDQVQIVARVSHGLWRTDFDLERRDGTLRASGSCPVLSSNCSIDYRIEAPQGVRIRVRSSNGDVVARELAAPVDLSSHNGDVVASAITGDVRLSSRNGEVDGTGIRASVVNASSRNGDVTIETDTSPRALRAESNNGNAWVVLPDDDVAYDLDLATRNGERSGQIRTDPTSERRLEIHSDNGDVGVRYRLR